MTALASKAAASEETKSKAAPAPKSVAHYIAGQIALCGKSQTEIADEVKFGRPNIITMIKSGACKLPISKIGPIAVALNIDPLFLFKLVMNEYEPETWKMIQDTILKQPLVTANEMEILKVVRSASYNDPKLRGADDKRKLLALIETMKPPEPAPKKKKDA